MSTSLTNNTLTFDSGSLGYDDIAKNMAGDSIAIVTSNRVLSYTSMQVGQTVYGGGHAASGTRFTINLSPSGTYKIARWANLYDSGTSWGKYMINDSSGGSFVDSDTYSVTFYAMYIITRIS